MTSGFTAPSAPHRVPPRGLTHKPGSAGRRGLTGSPTINPQKDLPATPSEGMVAPDYGRLERALEIEVQERQLLQSQLRDARAKYTRAVEVQAHLEDEVAARDTRIDALERETKALKHDRHRMETELAQQTADYINSQSRYLDSVAQLNDEVASLKEKLNKTTTKLASAEAAANKAKQRAVSVGAMKIIEPIPADNGPEAANELEYHQNALLVKELLARHEKMTEEVAQVRELNERLQEENENFQYLLVERTISGGVSLADDMEPTTPCDEPSFAESDSVSETYQSKPIEIGLGIDSPRSVQNTELERISDTIPPNIASRQEDPRKKAQALQFEVRSLENHNRALRTSLERLVHRLLDDKSFSKVVEESISARTLNRFNSRVASSYEAQRRTSGLSISPVPAATGKSDPAAFLSSMIFNAQYTGDPGRRVISSGVDDHAPPSPIIFGSPSRARSLASSVTSPSSFSKSTSLTDDEWSIELPKRIEHQTALRRLKLRD